MITSVKVRFTYSIDIYTLCIWLSVMYFSQLALNQLSDNIVIKSLNIDLLDQIQTRYPRERYYKYLNSVIVIEKERSRLPSYFKDKLNLTSYFKLIKDFSFTKDLRSIKDFKSTNSLNNRYLNNDDVSYSNSY